MQACEPYSLQQYKPTNGGDYDECRPSAADVYESVQ